MLAQEIQPDLIVIGPEQPLVDGAADILKQAGLSVVGPHREAVQLEGSKIFSKQFMRECGIATADYDGMTHMKRPLKVLMYGILLTVMVEL